MLFRLSLGDLWDDGHGKSKDFIFQTPSTAQQVRLAYMNAIYKNPRMNILAYCRGTEDSFIGKELADLIQCSVEPTPHEFAKIFIEVVKLGNPSITITEPTITDIAGNIRLESDDENSIFMGSVGYGLFVP
jgi:hypothetical protein